MRRCYESSMFVTLGNTFLTAKWKNIEFTIKIIQFIVTNKFFSVYPWTQLDFRELINVQIQGGLVFNNKKYFYLKE
jgi:hypothetical protein